MSRDYVSCVVVVTEETETHFLRWSARELDLVWANMSKSS